MMLCTNESDYNMTATNNTARKPAVVTAKVKQPSKAERIRNNATKANAKATKALPALDFDGMAANLVTAAGRSEGAARVLAHYMNNVHAEFMAETKVHWSALNAGNAKGNHKGVWESIAEKRGAVKDLAIDKGLANVNKPWSDMMRIAKDVWKGKSTTRDAVSLDIRQKADLLRLYKACMANELATDAELAVNEAIGTILVSAFKVDLSAINSKK